MHAERLTLFLPSQFLNLNLVQPNFYLASSIFIYYNGSNKKPTRKSFKRRINWKDYSCWRHIFYAIWSNKSSNDFLRQYEILNSELTVSKNCNRFLTARIVQLERNAVSNAQYHHRESLEINPVPISIGDYVLENSICRAFSLTSHEVKPDDLKACHRLKKRDFVIAKFKCRKQKCGILINRKNLCNKSNVLTQLNFSGRLHFGEHVSQKSSISYKCRKLKNAGKINSTWF